MFGEEVEGWSQIGGMVGRWREIEGEEGVVNGKSLFALGFGILSRSSLRELLGFVNAVAVSGRRVNMGWE